ncbi:MAG TPA: DUF3786 domain-containing protein [Armatimonadota bacterium]|nr:DUF3786 domain-containing protein [Armatimonadota bacterium]
MNPKREESRSVLERAQEALRRADPEAVAARSGAELEGRDGEAVLVLRLLDQTLHMTHPRLQVTRADGKPCPAWQTHLLTYYLSLADGTQPAGTWVALRDLADGMFYQRAYQGYSGDELVRRFGNDLEPLRKACRALAGEALNTGDAGYRFRVLPRVWLAVVYWLGEDAIPPSARVLFDAAIRHYLPTDSCAALGGWLARRIVKQWAIDQRLGDLPEAGKPGPVDEPCQG